MSEMYKNNIKTSKKRVKNNCLIGTVSTLGWEGGGRGAPVALPYVICFLLKNHWQDKRKSLTKLSVHSKLQICFVFLGILCRRPAF